MSLKLASAGYNLLSKSVDFLWKNMCDIFILNFVFTQPLRQLCGRGLHTFHLEEGAQFFCFVDKHTTVPHSKACSSRSVQVLRGGLRRSLKRGEVQPTLGAEMAGLSCSSTDKLSWEEQASIPGRRNRKCQSKGRKMQTSPRVWGWVVWRGRSCS